MNNGPTAAKSFMEEFLPAYKSREDRTVIIFSPAVSLTAVSSAIAGRRDVLAGVQNIYWAEKGAFTGETSAPMAADAGATIVLVGHSERRHVFGESDAQCARKCQAAAKAHLRFMLCLGETPAPRWTLPDSESHLGGFHDCVRAGLGNRNGTDSIGSRRLGDSWCPAW